MSFWASAIKPAMSAVTAPMTATTVRTSPGSMNMVRPRR